MLVFPVSSCCELMDAAFPVSTMVSAAGGCWQEHDEEAAHCDCDGHFVINEIPPSLQMHREETLIPLLTRRTDVLSSLPPPSFLSSPAGSGAAHNEADWNLYPPHPPWRQRFQPICLSRAHSSASLSSNLNSVVFKSQTGSSAGHGIFIISFNFHMKQIDSVN